MGTELQRRDADTRLPLWSARALLQDPELVWTVHSDESGAGADILTANTFRTHARSLAAAGADADAAELTAQAVGLAHRAAAVPRREIFVAGSLSPLEDCYRPDLAPDDAALAREHGAQARLLAAAGVDLILAETHNSIREAEAALRAAKATGVPVAVSLVTDGAGRLLSGEPIEEAAARLVALSPDAIGINCVPATRVYGELDAAEGGRGRSAADRVRQPRASGGREGLELQRGARAGGLRRGGRALDRAGRADRRRLLRHDAGAHARGQADAGREAGGGSIVHSAVILSDSEGSVFAESISAPSILSDERKDPGRPGRLLRCGRSVLQDIRRESMREVDAVRHRRCSSAERDPSSLRSSG